MTIHHHYSHDIVFGYQVNNNPVEYARRNESKPTHVHHGFFYLRKWEHKTIGYHGDDWGAYVFDAGNWGRTRTDFIDWATDSEWQDNMALAPGGRLISLRSSGTGMGL